MGAHVRVQVRVCALSPGWLLRLLLLPHISVLPVGCLCAVGLDCRSACTSLVYVISCSTSVARRSTCSALPYLTLMLQAAPARGPSKDTKSPAPGTALVSSSITSVHFARISGLLAVGTDASDAVDLWDVRMLRNPTAALHSQQLEADGSVPHLNAVPMNSRLGTGDPGGVVCIREDPQGALEDTRVQRTCYLETIRDRCACCIAHMSAQSTAGFLVCIQPGIVCPPQSLLCAAQACGRWSCAEGRRACSCTTPCAWTARQRLCTPWRCASQSPTSRMRPSRQTASALLCAAALAARTSTTCARDVAVCLLPGPHAERGAARLHLRWVLDLARLLLFGSPCALSLWGAKSRRSWGAGRLGTAKAHHKLTSDNC